MVDLAVNTPNAGISVGFNPIKPSEHRPCDEADGALRAHGKDRSNTPTTPWVVGAEQALRASQKKRCPTTAGGVEPQDRPLAMMPGNYFAIAGGVASFWIGLLRCAFVVDPRLFFPTMHWISTS